MRLEINLKVNQNLPVANPAKNLAAINMPAPLAKMVSNQLSRNGTERMSTVGLLPTLLASMPTGRALSAAPMARIEDTKEPGKRTFIN